LPGNAVVAVPTAVSLIVPASVLSSRQCWHGGPRDGRGEGPAHPGTFRV
jgi:hypothetical protein